MEATPDIIRFDNVEERIILLREQKVILNSDVAMLYGVKTKEVNQAVKNNPDKFPPGYIFELTLHEKKEVIKYFDHFAQNGLPSTSPESQAHGEGVVKYFDHLPQIKLSPTLPTAFTEKGLYMLATILKSKQATQTTIAIVEAFAKLRELTRTVAQMADTSEEPKQKALMDKSGNIMAELLGENLHATNTETSIELNLAVLKFKHTVKRKEEE